MRYLSVCSGIEAATVAWRPLGFRPLAFCDIDPFARAVLAHHYPDVPLHGDFTLLRDEAWIAGADILVGGTPCQGFSIAGLRRSLDDDRGNLSLEFVRLAHAIDALRRPAGRPPAIIVWENVPGVLSVRDNAFGCFLSGLSGEDAPFVPPRGKWTNAGVALGPARAVAWRILDAQYFGLAQRRRRVFVVASARAGFDPAAVLLEFEGLRRDSPPRREAGKDAAGGAAPGTDERRSHWDGTEHPHPTLNQSFNTGAIGYSNQELFSQRGAGLVGEASTGEISHCLNAGGMGRQDYETETLVTHALRAEGCDASEDGTGRGTPLVPVAFSSKDHGADATEDLSPTLRAMPHRASHANGGGQMAVAIPINEVGKRTGPSSNDDPRAGTGIGADGDPMFTLQAGARHGVAAYAFQPRIARNGRGDMGDIVNALNAQSGETGKGDAAPCVAAGMAVRRLTPVEAERLQGFEDGYTAIPWRNRLAGECPDGPRYRALGNSMAVPVMRWIGRRIAEALR
ncbi:MAG: DNA cytosine methyltransferase [Aestuariivirga sp.]|uniref:DNA cytosine methyltransferase n=1 Tax=Aestuariivirga sp. TaxID=2650926 RepID=UPI0038CF349C